MLAWPQVLPESVPPGFVPGWPLEPDDPPLEAVPPEVVPPELPPVATSTIFFKMSFKISTIVGGLVVPPPAVVPPVLGLGEGVVPWSVPLPDPPLATVPPSVPPGFVPGLPPEVPPFEAVPPEVVPPEVDPPDATPPVLGVGEGVDVPPPATVPPEDEEDPPFEAVPPVLGLGEGVVP